MGYCDHSGGVVVGIDAVSDSQPGMSNAPPEDDTEDWEKGIETLYSVKSVTYVEDQRAAANGCGQRAVALPRTPQTYSHPAYPTHPPPPPSHHWDLGYTASTNTQTEKPTKYAGRPPEESDSGPDSDGYYISNIPTTTQPQEYDIPPKSAHRHVELNSPAVPDKKPTNCVGRPADDSDSVSDCDDVKWDFGDNKKPAPTNGGGEDTRGKAAVDLATLVRQNPGVCVTWLQSLVNHKDNKCKATTPGGKDSNRSMSGAVRGDEPKLWPEMNLFVHVGECDRWRGEVQTAWGRGGVKATSELLALINQCFCSVEDPYATALYLIESVNDCRNVKTCTLSHYVAREFEKWTRRNPGAVHVLKRGGEHVQVYAFYVGTRFHMTAFDFIVKAFQLAYNEFLIAHIKPFVQLGRLKEACHCISRLGLHQHFNTEHIVFPLILQDKVNLVEQYVYQHKKQQLELLALLDRLCEDNVNLNKLAEDSGVKNIRYNKLDRKALGKMAVRLMKLYQIPQDVCPNVDRRRSLSAMRYMFYKFYVEESVSRETWRELVVHSVANNAWLQGRLVEELLTYNDVTEAVWWVRRCQMVDEALPITVLEALAKTDNAPDPVTELKEEENWEEDLLTNSSVYVSLKVPLSEVRIIDTRSEFIDAVHYVVKNTKILGLDAEWRPAMGRGTRVALLQMATPTRVYLLDVIGLCHELTDADWAWFGEQVFLNAQIVKLGYGFEGDVQMLSASIPALKGPIINTRRMVELEKLHRQVRKNPDAFKSKVCVDVQSRNTGARMLKCDERGLSGMVRHCLGRPLDKAEQMSDWEKRPLRLAQVVYAALDALVLIELYEHVVEHAGMLETRVPLEPWVSARCEAHRSRMEKRQARVTEKSDEYKLASERVPAPVCGPPISPSELAVVVDTMIQGLGRYLRSCGVDTRILDSNEDHDAALDIALREKRVILTCGQPYLSMCTQVPDGMCYNVSTNEKAREQALDVLERFNVLVTEADIFSRCQVCNGARYLHITPEDMRSAWDRRTHLLTKHHGRLFPPKRPVISAHPPLANKKPTCPTRASIYDADFTWDHVDMDDVTVGDGVVLQVEAIPRDITYQVKVFYVCAGCGKVYWEGKHFSGVCEQFSKVLNRSRRSVEEQPPQDMAAKLGAMLTLNA